MQFTIRLAGIYIEICSIYNEVYHLCSGYLTNCISPDFRVVISQKDIAFECTKCVREAEGKHLNPIRYPDSYLETLAVYRKIAVRMLAYDTFLMHGSVVAVGGEAFMFTAPSGTGKTTHTRLWLENIPGSYVLNGDKPLIRVKEGFCEACGTPWSGKECMNANEVVPLRAICLLERGPVNSIEEITFLSAYPHLFRQTYLPTETDAVRKTMELVRQTGENVRLYHLSCNISPEAALLSAGAMRQQQNKEKCEGI